MRSGSVVARLRALCLLAGQSENLQRFPGVSRTVGLAGIGAEGMGGAALPVCCARRRWQPRRQPKRTIVRYWALGLVSSLSSARPRSTLIRQTLGLAPVTLYS